MYKGPLVAPCPARTRSLTGRARRAPSKDPASSKGPSSLKELLLKPGTLYCIGPRGGGFARLSVARPTRTRDGRPALSLCSLSPCMYIYIYVYVFLPFFLLRWGSHSRSPNGSTRRSADGLPNEHPTDHQTEIDRSRRRQPNRSPNSANRSPKRSPAGHPNRGKKERRGHRRIEQNRNHSPHRCSKDEEQRRFCTPTSIQDGISC